MDHVDIFKKRKKFQSIPKLSFKKQSGIITLSNMLTEQTGIAFDFYSLNILNGLFTMQQYYFANAQASKNEDSPPWGQGSLKTWEK